MKSTRIMCQFIAKFIAGIALGIFGCVALAQDTTRPELRVVSAEHVAASAGAMILGATLAGTRVIAVGDHGVVQLSDDSGKSFRQARVVPVSSTLTGVSFVDSTHGWAVGQWGVVIATADGGETWTLQRSDLTVDQPLFSVYFKTVKEGWAVGLWSIVLHTADGGQTWTTVSLPAPPRAKKADRNLYKIFADNRGTLYIACEQGRVLQSMDNGLSWRYIETGYTGSFWTGIALQDGVLLVAGLRGTIYRSADGGRSWYEAADSFKSSVTDIVELPDKTVIAVGLDGVSLRSSDDGKTFTGTQRADRIPLTAAIVTAMGTPVVFSTSGPIS